MEYAKSCLLASVNKTQEVKGGKFGNFIVEYGDYDETKFTTTRTCQFDSFDRFELYIKSDECKCDKEEKSICVKFTLDDNWYGCGCTPNQMTQ